MANLINLLVILMFIILGVQFLRQKWLFLIAGFNMLNDKEKAQVNIPVLSKIVGIFCLSVACLNMISLYSPKYNHATTSLIFLLLIILIILSNTIAKKK